MADGEEHASAGDLEKRLKDKLEATHLVRDSQSTYPKCGFACIKRFLTEASCLSTLASPFFLEILDIKADANLKSSPMIFNSESLLAIGNPFAVT